MNSCLPEAGWRRVLFVVAAGAAFALAVWGASHVRSADWYGTLYPAGRGVLSGRSPYDLPLFGNPPWGALLLVPFALFPVAIGRGLLLVCSVAGLIYLAWRMRAPRIAVIALLLSPTGIGSLLVANIDSLVLLGVLLPPASGLLLLLIKPQIGFGAAIFYLIESYRTGRIAGVVRTFAPILVASLLGAALFPIWIDRIVDYPANAWNRSLFPFGIPVGLLLLWTGIRRRNVFLAMASTPFFTPYLTFYTYLVVQVGLLHPDVEAIVRRNVLHVVLCVALWIVMLAFKL